MSDLPLKFFEILRPGNIRQQDFNRAIDDAEIGQEKMATIALVRFIGDQSGAAFTFDVLVDGAGLTALQIIERARQVANGRRLVAGD